MNDRTILLALTSACFIGCGGAEAEPADQPTQTALPAEASTCEIVTAGMALPIEVRETSGLARSIKTVAEGVETDEQVTALRELGCGYAQGYHFAQPMPADEFERRFLR
jgi:hypothetical protein